MAGNSNPPAAGPATPRAPAVQSRTAAHESDDEIDEQTERRFTIMEGIIDQMNAHIQRLQAALTERDDHVEQLEAQVMAIPVTGTGTPSDKIKLPKPMAFDGTRSKLRTFLVNMEMHIESNQIKDDKKRIIFVASCFTDAAAEWIQPMLSEFYTIDKDSWGTITQELFSDYATFKQKLEESFGNIDELRTAERQLRYLRQTGSAQQLAIKFRQIVTPLRYDDAIQIATFENMLKEEVQTELIKLDRPDSIDKFIEMAVKIDNKLFEIKQKRQEFQRWKKVGGFPQYANTSAKRGTQYDKDGDVKMHLNAIVTKEEKERRKKEKACYKCGKKGHFAKQCRQGSSNGTANQNSTDKIATIMEKPQPPEDSNAEGSTSQEELGAGYYQRIIEKGFGAVLAETREMAKDVREILREGLVCPESSEGRLRQSFEEEPAQEECPKQGIDTVIEEPRREDQYSQNTDDSSSYQTPAGMTGQDDDDWANHEDLDRENNIVSRLEEIRQEIYDMIEHDYEEEQEKVIECNCRPSRAVCWEESMQTWQQHIRSCPKCYEWTHNECPMHGKGNMKIAEEYERLSHTRGTNLCDGAWGHVRNCSCVYFPQCGGLIHADLDWTLCFDLDCDRHWKDKNHWGWIPTKPRILNVPNFDCPFDYEYCDCVNTEIGHPMHYRIAKEDCRSYDCLSHRGLRTETPEQWDDHFKHVQRYKDQHRRQYRIAVTMEHRGDSMTLETTINKHKARILVDSGATRNYIDQKFIEQHNLPFKQTKEWAEVVGANGETIIEGYKKKANATVRSNNYYAGITFDIAPLNSEYYDAIVGMSWLKQFNPIVDWEQGKITIQGEELRIYKPAEVIAQTNEKIDYGTKPKPKETYEKELAEVMKKLPKKYHEYIELFVKKEYRIPTHPPEYEATIELKPGAQLKQVKQKQKSRDEQEAEDKFIDTFYPAGYLQESCSANSARNIYVPKKDGTKRVVHDYRQLNNQTVDDANKASHQEQKRDLLQGAKIMTMFDVEWGYYNLRMRKEDIPKTAILTDKGLYEWVVAPMGLKNLPAQFARYMTYLLRDYLNKFVAVYFDDIIVFSKDPELHDGHVRSVMDKLMKAGITLKIKKCEFDTTTVKYLGMIYSTEGLQIPPEKVDAIINWPTPTNVTGVQGFLGISGYVRRYLEQYADTSRPMTMLLRKEQPFEWREKQQQAFEKIKELVRKAPILQLHDPELQSMIRPDASGFALGLVYEQIKENGERVIVAFYSRQFTMAERNYDVHDRELLAIVEAFKHWRHYLQGSKHEIIVKSDHHNLTYFTTTKELAGRQARWAEYLARFNFRIEHIKGKENVTADALSRRPDYSIGIEQPKTNILRKDSDGIRYNKKAILATTITVNETEFEQKFREATRNDDRIQKELRVGTLRLNKGFALWNDRVMIPSKMIMEIIQEHHDPPNRGHQGIEKTLEGIQRVYYYPNIAKEVAEYIRKCDECNRNKPSRHKPYGKMNIMDTPTQAWESITVDFIQGLPQSKDPVTGIIYTDAIIIVDRLTKYIILSPTLKDMTAEQCAILMLRIAFNWTGLPTEIISDRDKLFTSKYWQTITKICGTTHKLSTANHQQTDGQSERMIQTVQQYLRHYLDWNQADWVELLPIAQFALNNTENATTRQVPHYANLGRQLRMSWTNIPREGISEQAEVKGRYMQMLHQSMSRDIQWAEQKMKAYYDKKREDAPILEKGERVYLLRRTMGNKNFNIPSKKPSNKLDAIKYGPFTIKKKLANDNYELQLPSRMKIHPIFHISLLEPTASQHENYDEADEEEHEVERIVRRKVEKGRILYLVKWKGYSEEHNSWEPVRHLNCPEKIREYHQRVGQRGPNRRNPRY
jgi:hypothetical protein